MSSQPPVIQNFQFQSYDPDRLREVINGADLEHTILNPWDCSGKVKHWHDDKLSIDRGFYSFPVFVRGQFAHRKLCIGISRGKEEPTWVNGQHLEDSSLQVYAEGAEMLYRAGASTDWAALTVSRETLQAAALQHLGFELDLPAAGMRNYTTPPGPVDRLMTRIHQNNRPFSNLNEATEEPGDQVLRLCVEALGSQVLEQAGRIEARSKYRVEVFRRADIAIRCLIDEGANYSSTLVCGALGVSERNLQLHFQEALGISPKRWFRQIALNRVRSSLLRNKGRPGIVAEEAMKYSFEHLGRFSKDYRDLFGESPSQTARRDPERLP
ncbi:MAG: helix-turn-helix domain-containing protein [Verrucomicrobiales bacterium]|nr:helix-turn-helix domain-containing protein [Verrucomicrobiales bacterium]